MSRTVTSGLDYTNKDYEAYRAMMIAKLKEIMPEYTDLRQTDAGVVILELNAMGLDIVSFHQDVIANEVYLKTAEQRDSADKWCEMLGYTPRNATPSKVKQVFVLDSVKATDTTIPKGTVVKTTGTSIEPEIKFETEADLVIPAGKLGNEQTNSVYDYTVTAVQGTSVNNELLGSSTGLADQSFTLSYLSAIVDTIVVSVNEGTGFVNWTRVDSFVDSEKDSRHFKVTMSDANVAKITFGNGVFGKIPVARANNIYCSYRIGGGEVGNVGANKIDKLGSNLAVVNATFNPALPFEYGVEKETLAEIKVNAPIYSRTLWGALIEKDFADLVMMNFPTVIQAVAVQDTVDIDDLYIYVLLQGNEALDQELEDEILDFFDENKGGRKIVGIGDIFVESATFVPLTLVADLVVNEEFSRSVAVANITAYINDFFAVGNYPFNTDLSLSRLASDIIAEYSASIKAFRFTTPATDIQASAVNEIFSLNTLTINATGGVS